MEKMKERIKASDIENYDYHFNEESIHMQSNYDGEEEIIIGIINLCRSDKDIDEIKKKLRYGIIGHFVAVHNDYISIKEALDKYMRDKFEEASQEVRDGGNYGWSMSFSRLLYNLKTEIKNLKIKLLERE